MTAAPAAPERRRSRSKRRRVVAVVTTVVVFAALVVGYFALDAWAREQVRNYVSDTVRDVLSLESKDPVAVEIGGASVIAQLVTGSLDEISVDVDEVTIGDLTGDVSLRAEGVPVDTANPVELVQIEFSVDGDDLASIANSLSASAIESVQIVDDEIRFGTDFTVFGVSFTVGIGVEPFASDGDIGFTPTSVELAGSRSSAESLIDQFGRPAEQLLQTRAICVADRLPASLAVEDAVIRGDKLVVSFEARDALLDEASLSALGSCG